MKRWVAAFAFLLLAGPVGSAAQSGLEVRVTPRAGVMTPADWFYVEYSHFGNPPVEWTEAAILRAPVVGLGVEVAIPNTGLWVRGEVTRSIDAITSMTHAVLFEPSGFEPARTERTPYRVAMSLTTGTVDLAFPTRFSVGPVQPYVTAGVGGALYGFDTDPFLDLEDRVVLPEGGTVWAANLGIGASVQAFGLTFDFQLRDAISDYWERLQHNVMVLGGLSWRVF